MMPPALSLLKAAMLTRSLNGVTKTAPISP
jgi:hypothetical protein